MAEGLTSTGVDPVRWGQALGLGSSEEVAAEVATSAGEVSGVLDGLAQLMTRLADYPDEGMVSDLSGAFALTENVGQTLLHVSRSIRSGL